MPIKHAALKEMRKGRRRHARNQAVRSELKTLTKRFLELMRDRKPDEAKPLLQLIAKKYDRAAFKKIIHRNTAARYKSRLAKRLNTLPAQK